MRNVWNMRHKMVKTKGIRQNLVHVRRMVRLVVYGDVGVKIWVEKRRLKILISQEWRIRTRNNSTHSFISGAGTLFLDLDPLPRLSILLVLILFILADNKDDSISGIIGLDNILFAAPNIIFFPILFIFHFYLSNVGAKGM